MGLYKYQEKAVNDIVGNIFDFRLYEAPTGFGKTHVLISTAVKLIQKYGKKVIISTSNNKLAKDIMATIQNNYEDFNIGKDAFSLVLGKSNYIDRAKLLAVVESGELFESVEKESFIEWYEQKTEEEPLYFDDFNDNVVFIDLGYIKTIQDELSLNTRPAELPNFDNSIISITNHYYLLYCACLAKNIELEDYFVLIDEVHEIPSCAQVIFEKSFSPFNLKNICNKINKEITSMDIEWAGKKSLLSSLKKTAHKMQQLISESIGIANAYNCIGEYITSQNEKNEQFDKLKKMLTDYHSSENHTNITAHINKTISTLSKSKTVKQESIQSLVIAKKELSELDSVLKGGNSQKKKENLGIYMSPAKGYPTYKSQNEDPLSILHFRFWEKIVGFAGLSATLMVDTKTSESSHYYAYRRLGIQNTKASPITQYKRMFPKENIDIFMPQENFPSPPSDYENNDEIQTWAKAIADYVIFYEKEKNCMIVCGGYKEAEIIAKALTEIAPHKNIIYAQPNTKTAKTIKQFEEEGGILVGTRNYGVGISLEGKKLERLFITRFPYPIFTSKFWLDKKDRQGQYYWLEMQNEMILALRQYMGRIQRLKTDEGEIHILDSRIFSKGKTKKKYTNPSLKRRIWHFVGEYGIIKKEAPVKEHKDEHTLLVLYEEITTIEGKEKDTLDWL